MENATRDEILAEAGRVHEETAAYWSSFATPAFFAKPGEAWSPAENVRHLIKSIRAVVKAMSLPKIAMWVMFGRTRRKSVTYDALRTRYLGLLAAGGKAGKFGPSNHTEDDLEAWRTTILRHFDEANVALRAAIARWPDAKLDRYQIPHPLLGKLTVREMLYFTLYHERHHVDVVRRRT